MAQELPKWKLQKQFENPFTMALIGSTKSGKTTFLNYLIPKIHSNFDFILFFSTNSHAEVYAPIIKLKNVIPFSAFSDDAVKLLFENNKDHDNEFSILVLMDDEINSKNSKVIKNLFSTLRNSNFSTIFSGQDYSFISKSNRNNINYVFIFKQNSNQGLNDVYKLFLKGNLDKFLTRRTDKKFAMENQDIEFVRKNTSDYNIIVLDILNDYNMYTFKTPL